MGLLDFLFKQNQSKAVSAPTPKPGSVRKGSGQSSNKALPDIEIPKDKYLLNVEGTQWGNHPGSISTDRIFSLTPRNKYQVEHDWPEVGIVNVNRKGSRRTTEKNWFGYIPAAKAVKLLRVVETHGTTSVHAAVNGSDITLMLPESYR